MPKFLLAVVLIVVLSQVDALPLQADEAEQVKKIEELLQAQQTAPAEEAFQAALKEFPESQSLKNLHLRLYLAQARAGNLEAATAHAESNFEQQLQALTESPRSAQQLVNAANILTNVLLRSGKSEAATARLEAALAAVAAQLAKQATPELTTARSELRKANVQHLLRSGKAAEGQQLLKEELAGAAADFAEHPDDFAALTRFVQWRETEISAIAQTDPTRVPALWANYLDLLTAEARKKLTDERVVGLCINGGVQAIRGLMSDAPEIAERRLAELKELIESVDAKPIAMKTLVDRANQMISQLERTLAAERLRLALIGKPAIPLDVEAWANGEPLAASDLTGKVVLLDFWAVWCGPCIATFPHLREWNEKYGSQGLVVIGATRYYQYDWDDEAKKIKADKQLTPEQEQAALVRFAAHHELKHRFAVVPKASEFQTAYGVTGIPQVVLIDRAGIVRMIRVGSGDKNAHDLEEMLKKLLAETP